MAPPQGNTSSSNTTGSTFSDKENPLLLTTKTSRMADSTSSGGEKTPLLVVDHSATTETTTGSRLTPTTPWWQRSNWFLYVMTTITVVGLATLCHFWIITPQGSIMTTTTATMATTNPPPPPSWKDPAVQELFRELESKLQGRLILPRDDDDDDGDNDNDDDFETASHVWNQVTKPPLGVVEVANEADVALALPILIQLAAAPNSSNSIPFVIRSGGHQYAGWSGIENGIILSLSNLNQIEGLLSLQPPAGLPNNKNSVVDVDDVDDVSNPPPSGPIALWLGPTVRVQDILQQVHQAYRYSSVIGMCRTVAVGGYALGGGQGLWARQYGLGLDQLVAARLVLANGTLLETNATHHPEILWALQGAGQQNFGIVTRLRYKFYPSYDGVVLLSGDISHSDMALFFHRLAELETQRALPGAIGAFFSNGNTVDTYSITVWYTCFQDADLDIGQEYLLHEMIPLLTAATAVTPTDGADPQTSVDYNDMSTTTSSNYSISIVSWYDFSMHQVPLREGNYVHIWNGFLYEDQNTFEICEEIWHWFRRARTLTEYAKVGIELWGGAISKNRSPEDTAFYWRNGIYNVHLWLSVPVEVDPTRERFDHDVAVLQPIWDQIAQYLTGTYLNYAEPNLPDYARVTYGGNLERLVALKQELDPNNVFYNPQSLPMTIA